MIDFHTPELPEPLGLDLAQLQGGGSCPSQFYGKTHDQLDVYVRYRGGALKVYIGNEPGDNALRDGKCILETDVGPPFDGSMSLTQFCTNFGVTINGAIPDETDTDAHRYTNLTGQVTYCQISVSGITIETSRKIVGNAWSAFPNALLVQPIVNDQYKLECLKLTKPAQIDTSSVWLIDGPSLLSEIDTSPEEYVLPKSDQLQISISFISWEYPAPKYTSRLCQAEKDLDRALFVPGERNMPKEIELTTDSLRMDASFPKGDQAARDALESLSKAILQQFPVTTLERVDLATEKPISHFDKPLDPVIADWCKSDLDRWVAIIQEKQNSPWIGIRPRID